MRNAIHYPTVILTTIILTVIYCIFNTPVSADIKQSNTAHTNNIHNVAIAMDKNGYSDVDASVVKIIDGCRVVYIAGTYENVSGHLSATYSGRPVSIAVSDIACK